MKRHQYHFPLPRRERITAENFSEANFSVPFMEVNCNSISKKIEPRKRVEQKKPQQIIAPKTQIREAPVPKKPEKKHEVSVPVEVEVLVVREPPVTSSIVFVEDRHVKERVSVVLAYRDQDRLKGLLKSIESIRAQSVDCYIILVEQDKNPAVQKIVEPLVDHYLFTYSPKLFNKGWAFNCGAVISKNGLLLLHDADLIATKNYVLEAMQLIDKKDMVLPWAKIHYLTKKSSDTYPDGPLHVSYTAPRQPIFQGSSIFVRKKFYMEIGGHDERFEGWGSDDNAFLIKCNKLGRTALADLDKGPTLIHYYHTFDKKVHEHSNINYKLLSEYYNGSVQKIKTMIKNSGPIGNPLKYHESENRRNQMVLASS